MMVSQIKCISTFLDKYIACRNRCFSGYGKLPLFIKKISSSEEISNSCLYASETEVNFSTEIHALVFLMKQN